MDKATMTQTEQATWGDVATSLENLAQLGMMAPTKESVSGLLEMARGFDKDTEADGCSEMRCYADEHIEASLEDVARELAIDWTSVFRGMNRQTGPKPPYAGVWLSSDGVGVDVMLAVNRSYVEAGLGANETSANRLDYFGIQLEFASRLARRIAEGDDGAPLALANFLDRYFLSWFDLYVADVEDKGKTAFWKGYLHLVASLVKDTRLNLLLLDSALS